MKAPHPLGRFCWLLVLSLSLPLASALHAQGVTTATLSGLITARDGGPLVNASVVAVHVPSGTQYRAVTRTGGAYTIPDMRIGGPYRVTSAATLSGLITARDGGPLVNASVVAVHVPSGDQAAQ